MMVILLTEYCNESAKVLSFTQVSGQTIRTGILKLALCALSRGWKSSIMRRF